MRISYYGINPYLRGLSYCLAVFALFSCVIVDILFVFLGVLFLIGGRTNNIVMGIFQVVLIISGLAQQILAAPKPADAEISGSVSGGIPPLLSFKDGTIGVNFLGFKASAGLGGILTGDASHGGLHAEAETPFGQRAAAGLGGHVDGSGRSTGGLYAGATAGGGIGAAAGLDGTAGADGSAGRTYAGASSGTVGKTVITERFGGVPAPADGAALSGSFNIQKIASPVHSELVVEKVIPTSKVTIEVEKEKSLPAPPAVKKTVIERTVIPNYVEKTIQVPSYVEKTIRVPTTIEKRIKVPAPPTIIEKEVEVPAPPPVHTKEVIIQNEEVPITYVATKTRTKIHRRPWLHYRKRFNYYNAPYYGGVVADNVDEANLKADSGVSAAANANTYSGIGYGYGPGYYGSQGTVTVRKEFNGNLIKDIFNIPIATLGAVSNLVGNIAGGASGSVAVSKSYGTYKK